MANITATILVPMDLASGATAINYKPTASLCPILAIHCIAAGGTGVVKITPLRAAELVVGGSGSGGRLRVACNALGELTTVEIANPGSGYTDGPVPITIEDPNGSGGSIACTASGGVLNAVSITSPGTNYSGYISLLSGDFVEGVTYDFSPRFIEWDGTGTLTLLGYRLSFRPFQVF